MEDEERVESGTGSEGSEESEVMIGGPGQENDEISNPPDREEEPTKEETETARPEGEVEPPPPKFKFKSQIEAERAHLEATRKISEQGAELSRINRLLSQGGPTPTPAPVREPVWKREKLEFDKRVASIPKPNESDAEGIQAYNEKVKELYYETHDEFADIAMREKAQAREHQGKMWSFITSEAKKYGIDDTPFDLINEDGTVEKGTMSNVFHAIALSPAAFGINILAPDGRHFLSLDQQVAAIAKGINRFVDSIVRHKQSLVKQAEAQRRDLSGLRRGSRGPVRTEEGEEEPEDISSFAEGIEQYKKGRKRVKDTWRK
ncbi:MAG: hypothetical protein ABSG44_09265 [Thermodesulfobacteriota bacterium]|jgi:hypothetical protein